MAKKNGDIDFLQLLLDVLVFLVITGSVVGVLVFWR